MNIDSVPAYFRDLLARWRERQLRPEDLLQGKDGVIMVGAGKVGQEFLAALRLSRIPILGFSDNSPAKWGTSVSGLPVLAPAEAARRFGNKALFLITIGRVGKGVSEIRDQFSGLGAASIMHFIEAIQFIPGIWSNFFLNPNAFTEDDCEYAADAYRLLRDDDSRKAFLGHLGWRMTLDSRMLPIPQYDNQYFPPDIITPRHCTDFVDIGAYTGDTLLALKDFAGPSLSTYYGFEPDPHNFDALVSQAGDLSASSGVQVHLENVAIGSTEKTIAFSDDGVMTSHASSAGKFRVLCKTLDSLRIPNPSFVKIDTEGFEDEVLRGADLTLRTWRPTVAIASYHRPRDLFELPLRLARVSTDYKFHFRPHGDAGVDLVCYAVREPASA